MVLVLNVSVAGGQRLDVSSPMFRASTRIPTACTCEGSDRSPALDWSAGPHGTRSYLIICDDPDAPGGTWTHWVAFDIPASVTHLDGGAGVPKAAGFVQGRQDFGDARYGGPCPPRGHGIHHYHFRVYALDIATLQLAAGATRAEVERQIQGHVLAHGELVGVYSRS